jgi:hypothetical protein
MVPVRPRNQGVKIPGLCSVPADRSASLCRPAGEAAPVALPEPSCSKVPKMTTQPPLDREAAHQGRGLVHGGELREAIAQGGRRRLSRSGFRLSDSPNISAPSLAFANWWHHSVKQRSRVMSSSSPMRRASKIGACWRAAWASAQFKSSPLSPQSFSSSGMGLQSQSRTRMGRPLNAGMFTDLDGASVKMVHRLAGQFPYDRHSVADLAQAPYCRGGRRRG